MQVRFWCCNSLRKRNSWPIYRCILVNCAAIVGQAGCHLGRGDISSFETTVDNIGFKPGYGAGDYVMYPAEGSLFFGDDFASILGYFKGKRQDGMLNRKSDVSPLALKAFLPWISLLEPIFDAHGKVLDARVTLHGSEVAAAYSDNTGKLVTEVHAATVAGRIMASMQLACDRREGVVGISNERQVRPHIRLNILYLPLSNDGETISHFFNYVRLDPLD